MNGCCGADGGRKSSTGARRLREISVWGLPSILLVLVPKCPACLAAYVALWTGIGLSLSAAAYLRWAMLLLCVAALLFLLVKRLGRMRVIFSIMRSITVASEQR